MRGSGFRLLFVASAAFILLSPDAWAACTPEGRINYDFTNHVQQYCDGTSWQNVRGGQWTTAGSNIYYTSGNVGIGTTTPASPAGFAGVVHLQNATTASYVVDAGGSYRAEFGISSAGGWFSTVDSIPMRFATSNAERMRIDASGNVGIGVTNPSYRLHVQATSGNVAIYAWTNNESGGAVQGFNAYASAWGALGYANYGVYCIGTVCGGNQAWTNNSDARLKTAIQDLPSDKGLALILRLRPVTFHWKDRKQDAQLGERLGFIAQEVEPVLPQLVTRGGPAVTVELADGRKETVEQVKSLSYAEFVVPLVKAVQELKVDNDNLREDVVKLRREIQHAR